MKQGISADVKLIRGYRLGMAEEIGDLLLWEASKEHLLAFLVDLFAKDAHIFKRTVLTVEDSLVMQACPIHQQDGQVGVLLRVWNAHDAVSHILHQIIGVLPIEGDNLG